MMQENKMTEQEVRRIAREESMAIFEKSIKAVQDQVREVKKLSQENSKILGRLERLLLGELGVETSDTLKARANFAYQYAKKNTDAKIIERAIPALEWFEDMNTPDAGQKESKLCALGKIITFYSNIKWLFAILGVTTAVGAIQTISIIIHFIEGLN